MKHWQKEIPFMWLLVEIGGFVVRVIRKIPVCSLQFTQEVYFIVSDVWRTLGPTRCICYPVLVCVTGVFFGNLLVIILLCLTAIDAIWKVLQDDEEEVVDE